MDRTGAALRPPPVVRRRAALCLALGGVTLVLAWGCILLAQGMATVSPLWLVDALALVVVLRCSRSRSDDTALLASLGLASAVAHLLGGSPPPVAFALAVLDPAKVLLGTTLVRRFGTTRFRSMAEGWRLFFLAGPPGALLGALGAGLVTLLAARPDPRASGLTSFCADLLGFMLVAPLGMTLGAKELARLNLRGRWPEALGVAALVVGVTAAAFLQSSLPLLFTVTPFVVIATFRFRLVGANAAMLLVACVAVPLTYLGTGPLVLIHLHAPGIKILVLQAFLAINGLTAIPLAAALGERDRHLADSRRREIELTHTNVALERAARMAELAEEVGESGHWRLGFQSGEHYWSPGMFRIFGLPPAEQPPSVEDVIACYRPEERDAVRATLQVAIDTQTGCEWEREIVWPDGSTHHIRLISHVFQHHGQGPAMLGAVRDVTAEREAQRAVAESERRYRLLAENATDIIACFGLDGRFSYLSPACHTILGYRPEELIGRPTREVMVEEDHRHSIRLYKDYLSKGAPEEGFFFEYRAVRKDGSRLWLSGHPRALRDPETGEITGFQDVVRDVTDRKALERELIAARDEAQSATEAKSEFLANMSHELRTPLTSILGFSDLLRPHVCAEPASRYLTRIAEGGQTLLATVNDVLDFSKLEAGQIEIRPRPVSPAQLARSVCELLQPQADLKDLSLSCVVVGSASATVWLDDVRTRQVLTNLIGNALKFTDEGHVRLILRLRPGQLRFEVVDSGPGVAPERLDRLFKRFSQIDGSSTRSHGGTGLGLAISKGLVEAMGGVIDVESAQGQGSTFWFELPAPDVCHPASIGAATPGVDSVSLAGARVLVVDDNAINRELVRGLAAGVGMEITEADSGETAIELASITPFDVILMDVSMPGMGGVAAMREIRTGSGPNDAIPILAFTAFTPQMAPKDVDLGLFDGLVCKPLEASDLFARLDAALAGSLEPDVARESALA